MKDRYICLGSNVKLLNCYQQDQNLSKYDRLKAELQRRPFHIHDTTQPNYSTAGHMVELIPDDGHCWGEQEVKFIRRLLEHCAPSSFFRFGIIVGDPLRLEKAFQLSTTTKPVDNTHHFYEVTLTELDVDRRWTNI